MIEKFTTEISINTKGEAIRFANACYEVAEEFTINFCIWMSKQMINLDTDYKKEHFEVLLEEYKKTL
jgi:hypothetical protein